MLMQELRLRAARTDCARAQVWTLRERLLKLGAQVVISVRRLAIHLPAPFPFEQLPADRPAFWRFQRIASQLYGSVHQQFAPSKTRGGVSREWASLSPYQAVPV